MMSSNRFRAIGAPVARVARLTPPALALALWALTVLGLVSLTIPARAEDPIFPPGSRVGLVPPPGMVASNTFDGFADPGKEAAILITILPAAAFPQMDKTLDVDTLRKQGVSLEKREPMQFSFGKGFLLIGRQTADRTRYKKWLLVAGSSELTALVTVQVPELEDKAYPDRAVRAALATLAIRTKVPEAEELGLLPFAVGDFAGFHVEDVLRGRALMLSDAAASKGDNKDANKETTDKDAVNKDAANKDAASKDVTNKDAASKDVTNKDAAKEIASAGFDARMLIAALPGGPAEPDGRGNFARLSFNEIGGIRDVTITLSEPLRIGGQSGYQTMADAKDARTGSDVRVIQWLRFGGGGYLQMVGIGSADSWPSVLARLRTVRDSVELK
jgi:hypothetical protein